MKTRIADLLFPQYNACHLCERFPERPGMLCASCQKSLNALRFKRLKMSSYQPHPPLSVCLSAFPHRDEARELVHLLKYEADGAAASVLGESMAAVWAVSRTRLPDIGAVVPVPLHTSRLEERGYNQALLLAQEVCLHTGLSLCEDALVRLHPTDTQIHRDRNQRMQAMQHAFTAPVPKVIAGLHILLVDDVLTTGATSVSCAAALLEAGAESVSLLTACRA